MDGPNYGERERCCITDYQRQGYEWVGDSIPPHRRRTVRVLLRRASGELVGAVSGRLEHLALEELPGEWRGPIMDLEPWR